ncbi:MAG: dihydropteroate synthase [Prevotellaceae bacterium]|nr:dihydropteroate synthase [Prevotellaceae bacterium]MDY3366192.1 dihydropteroate synthase [Prevotella sp.]
MNIRGQLFDFSHPCVMGILNITPDSFFAGSRVQTEQQIARRVHQMMDEGAKIIDVGAFSTRPGAAQVSEEEEMERLRYALPIIRRERPEAIISIDTFRPDVARMCVEEWGADIINDVSEGGITGVVDTPLESNGETCPDIFRMVARLGVPYILMSVKPNLETMLPAFAHHVSLLRELGVKDIILDPGYGFGKTLEENYQLLNESEKLKVFDLPILVGMSRKRLVYQLVGGDATTALNGTTVVNTIALMKGANILRVHDVKAAAEAVAIYEKTQNPSQSSIC